MPSKTPLHRLLGKYIALITGFPVSLGNAQTIWEPISLPNSEQLRWQPLPASEGSHIPYVTWEALPHQQSETNIVWAPFPEDEAPLIASPPGSQHKPTNQADAERLLDSIEPSAEDYWPLLRLGPALPTANQVDELQGAQLSSYQLAPMAGGGNAGGTGNQNYVGRLDFGVNDKLQISGFYSEADDPLFSAVTINGQLANPSNFWQSYGGGAQLELLSSKAWKLGLGGSVEGWNVGSGGSLGAGQVSKPAVPTSLTTRGNGSSPKTWWAR